MFLRAPERTSDEGARPLNWNASFTPLSCHPKPNPLRAAPGRKCALANLQSYRSQRRTLGRLLTGDVLTYRLRRMNARNGRELAGRLARKDDRSTLKRTIRPQGPRPAGMGRNAAFKARPQPKSGDPCSSCLACKVGTGEPALTVAKS